MNNPLVSVITIFLNAAEFLEESVESVLKQSYTCWELLLVDDGSSDRSSEIAIKYTEKYPGRIFYQSHPDHQNKGMSASRNLGIKMSKGSLVCFLDADDTWMVNKLSDQIKIMENNPEISMLYGNTLFWYTWQPGAGKKDYIRRLGVKPDSVFKPPDLVPLFLVVAAAVPATCSIMCRKELFKKIQFEESFTGLYEDQAFYYKVCLTEKVYVSDRIWDKYRQHEHSVSYIAAKNSELYNSRIHFLLWLWNYIKNHNLLNQRIKIAICEELWKNQYLKNKKDISAKKLRWIIKWLFIFEMQFPERLRIFLWRRTETYKLLSSVNSQTAELTKTGTIIWNNR